MNPPTTAAPNRPPGALQCLKILWRDQLSDEAREDWFARLTGEEATPTLLREEIADRLLIKLSHDSQLKDFCDWIVKQHHRDAEAERMAEDERQMRALYGERWTLDEIRTEVLKKAYARTLATGDFDTALKTVNMELRMKSVEIALEKFKESLRSQLETALTELALHIRENPPAREAFELLKAAIGEAAK